MRTQADAPRQLFFSTPAQRASLARQQFFEEGVRPSGLVGEAVIQSWMRCRQARVNVADPVAFEHVTPSRLHSALGRNQLLLASARQELQSMESSLAGTACRVLLTDGEGVIVHATHNPMATQAELLKVAARVGVNLSESTVGTTAPGIVAKTGQACSVTGAEHYYECLRAFQCAAAPIRDAQGRLAAVLDVSVESRSFGFDAAAMVGVYATSIENRLLRAQSREQLVLRFQASPALLGTPMEALAGITTDGDVAWLNSVAVRLLGQLPDAAQLDVGMVFGATLGELLALMRHGAPRSLRLPSGLGVWAQACAQERDGLDFRHAVSVPVAAPVAAVQPAPVQATPGGGETTLGGHSRKLIESTLAGCGGNIARAARTLGVSRGTLYRRLQKWQAQAT